MNLIFAIRRRLFLVGVMLWLLNYNHIWSVVLLPYAHYSIWCKWMYKVSYNANATIDRYKARLVAKGHTQQEGLDYIEIVSLAAKMTTVKVLFALAVSIYLTYCSS